MRKGKNPDKVNAYFSGPSCSPIVVGRERSRGRVRSLLVSLLTFVMWLMAVSLIAAALMTTIAMVILVVIAFAGMQ